MLTHKGYVGFLEVDDEAGVIHGEVLNTRDVITFQGVTVAEARQAFIDSVEDYLEFCASRNEAPEKPFSGRFVLRLSPDEHRALAIKAKRSGKSLNEYIRAQLLSSA
jgi:predicted HicB family RNase H-like nuclease